MTDKEIIQKLIEHDEEVTRQFLFRDCRPLFISIIGKIFPYEVDYDEFVNELYVHLIENEGNRLSQFEGRSSIYQWIKVVAIRYFLAKKARMIENESNESLLVEAERKETVGGNRAGAKMDLYRLFAHMENKRHVYVLKRLIIDDAEPEAVAKELDITVDNLYNIKKRAIAALTKVATNDKEEYYE